MQTLDRLPRVLTIVALSLCLAVLSAPAQTLTAEQAVDLKQVTSVAMQPQGNYVAYTLRVPRGAEEEPGGSYTEIWVVPTRGGEPRQYTAKPTSASMVGWSPDGSLITFRRTASHASQTQVWAIPVDGGEARQLSHASQSILTYALAPDGRTLAYTMRDATPETVREQQRRGFDQRVEDSWDTIARLYVENLATGESHVAASNSLHVWDFSWSSDGSQLLFRGSERPFTDDGYMYTDHYAVPAEGGAATLVHDTVGKLAAGRYAPNGRNVAWLGAVSLNDPASGSLFVAPTGGGAPSNLTTGYEGTAVAFAWKDDATILLNTIERTRTHLYEVAIKDGRRRRLRGNEGPIFRGVSLTADGRHYATVCNTPMYPNEVCVGTSDGRSLERRTVSEPSLSQMAFGAQETIAYPSSDGLEITGVIIKPVGFREGVRYPLQMQVHGGPESAYLDGWNTSYSTPAQLLAQRGIMVFMPNYRGSTGRGVAFAKGDHNDPMGTEFDDMLAGIDYLIGRGHVDPDRVAVGGGSYGGYTSAWATTKHSDRFTAAVVFAGIANQISKIGMTDTPAENALVHWNFWHYDNWELVWDRSPLAHIHGANTPTLIGHGERDLRVPTGQAMELYRALKYVGVPAQLVIYPREPHGLRERAHQVDWSQRVVAWYERYLLGEATN